MKRQQSQSRIKVPNKNKVWYLKISIYLYPHQARNRKMTVGTGFQKYYWGRSLIFRNNLEEEKYCSWSKCSWSKSSWSKLSWIKNSWSKFSWIKIFLKQVFLTAHTNYYFHDPSVVTHLETYAGVVRWQPRSETFLVVGPPPSSWSILNQLRTYIIR